MKASIHFSAFTIITLWSLTTFGQASCHNDGGIPNNNGPGYINDPAGPYGSPGVDVLGTSQSPAAPVASTNPLDTSRVSSLAARSTSTTPAARITVVAANELPNTRVTSKIPTATLTIVTDNAVAKTNSDESEAEKPTAIDAKIAKLVGVWKAVARRSNGELTTVELHLDNRGWAELTVPGSDGKPSTSKSRVELENDELKLKGSDKVVSLGKLMEFNSRQMVLERAEGRVTFVRI